MAGFWGWFLAQTCKVEAVQEQLLLLSDDWPCVMMISEAADFYKKVAQGGLGPESYCRFWWHALLAFSSVLGAKLGCLWLNIRCIVVALALLVTQLD